ncbi:MAG: hypothetical protein JXM79_00375 [Sedimentisphaerales bacterium]|nr:hypothetical protein [Sedimentisphaerales bacterium]
MIRKTFKFRCYLNKGTQRRFYAAMKNAVTPIWNACVAEREQAREEYKAKLDEAFCEWVIEHKCDIPKKVEKQITKRIATKVTWPGKFSQYKHCSHTVHPEYKRWAAKMGECTVAQVDGSEKSYRELKRNGDERARPPQPKHLHRALMFRSSGWTPKNAEQLNEMESPALVLSGGRGQPPLGRVRVRLHRPVQGKIKTVNITEKNRRWYVSLSCEVPKNSGACGSVSAEKHGRKAGRGQKYTSTGGSDPEKGVVIDFLFWSGQFMRDSQGLEIPFPEFYWRDVEKLKGLSRKLSTKKWKCRECSHVHDERPYPQKGRVKVTKPIFCVHCRKELWYIDTANRAKARHTLRRWHEHIANQRIDWLWHVARYYVLNYERIVIPKWPFKGEIQYAVDNQDARKLCDASYAKFINCLKHKANEFGRTVIEVKDERYEAEVARLAKVRRYEKTRTILRETDKAVRWDRHWQFAYLTKEIKTLHNDPEKGDPEYEQGQQHA